MLEPGAVIESKNALFIDTVWLRLESIQQRPWSWTSGPQGGDDDVEKLGGSCRVVKSLSSLTSDEQGTFKIFMKNAYHKTTKHEIPYFCTKVNLSLHFIPFLHVFFQVPPPVCSLMMFPCPYWVLHFHNSSS